MNLVENEVIKEDRGYKTKYKVLTPPIEVLEKWRKTLFGVYGINISITTVLSAYYMEVGFLIGRHLDYSIAFYDDKNNWSDISDTTIREAMLANCSIIETGLPTPKNGDSDEYKAYYKEQSKGTPFENRV